jgi:hypothetical protein
LRIRPGNFTWKRQADQLSGQDQSSKWKPAVHLVAFKDSWCGLRDEDAKYRLRMKTTPQGGGERLRTKVCVIPSIIKVLIQLVGSVAHAPSCPSPQPRIKITKKRSNTGHTHSLSEICCLMYRYPSSGNLLRAWRRGLGYVCFSPHQKIEGTGAKALHVHQTVFCYIYAILFIYQQGNQPLVKPQAEGPEFGLRSIKVVHE